LRAPGAPRPRWAHHRPIPERTGRNVKAPPTCIPDNGICERFHRTILNEFYRIAFRKKVYRSLAELQNDLDAWLVYYNTERTHQGRWCYGKTPMQTFLDTREQAREKQIERQAEAPFTKVA
jgi:hypothetical protein